MYRLYQKYKDRDFIFIIPLVLLTLNKIFKHIYWRLSSGQGLPQSTDSRWYIDYTTCLWANLTDGPETRHYRARYLQKDTPTEDYSDVLVVTVPGRV